MTYQHKTRFVVLTNTIAEGWVNCWSEDDEPLTFATFEEAQEEVGDHLDSLAEMVTESGREFDREAEISNLWIVGPEKPE